MSKKTTSFALLASLLPLLLCAEAVRAQTSRDFIYIVGSSTVYPFATVVAERFGRTTRFRTPKVESTGTGGGIKLFCDGVGVAYPDIVNASRRMTRTELAACAANGVDGIIEVEIGYDGIVLGNVATGPALVVSRRQLYLALAKYLPGEREGELIDNPHRRWRDVAESLPDTAIEVFGPPPTSGTRDAFVELVFEQSCRQTAWVDRLARTDPQGFRAICHSVREDGAYVEAGENDNLIVQKLQTNTQAFGIVGFSLFDQNGGKIQAATVDGWQPRFESIASADYPLSRPLFFYAKKAHVATILGLRAYLEEFSAERTWGDDGYLSYRGLVPLSLRARRDMAQRVGELRTLSAARN